MIITVVFIYGNSLTRNKRDICFAEDAYDIREIIEDDRFQNDNRVIVNPHSVGYVRKATQDEIDIYNGKYSNSVQGVI